MKTRSGGPRGRETDGKELLASGDEIHMKICSRAGGVTNETTYGSERLPARVILRSHRGERGFLLFQDVYNAND